MLKAKAVPLHAKQALGWRYSSYSFLTSALDGGEWSVSRPSRALPWGKDPWYPLGLEAGWASELVWTHRLEEKSFASVRDRTVARHYTDWATPAHSHQCTTLIFRRSHIRPQPSTNNPKAIKKSPYTDGNKTKCENVVYINIIKWTISNTLV
jgi:hypothetical protein